MMYKQRNSQKETDSLPYDGHYLMHPMEINDDLTTSKRCSVSSPSFKRIFITTFLISVPLFTVAIVCGWIILPLFVNLKISQKFGISNDVNPELYSAWLFPPVPVYLKVYIFNVTNPNQVKSGGLPVLGEIGPYVFTENRTKIDISHDDLQDTVTYKEHITYSFSPELSGELMLSDVLTIINVPYIAAAMKTSNGVFYLGQSLIQSSREEVFVQKPVSDALFKGWKVPFLEKLETELGVGNVLPNNTFGFMYGLNGSTHGPFTISRGIVNKSSFGSVLRYKNETTLDVWGDRDSSCNAIHGTDGTLVPPHVTKSTVVRLFNAELCRSIYLTYQEEAMFQGVKGYKFTAPLSTISDPRQSLENSCFCPDLDEECAKAGALYIGPCKDDAPIAISNPHFYNAVPEYIEQSGLNPDKEKHETFMIIEPTTGLILKASKKIQVNLILKQMRSYSALKKIPEMLFPLVWADECAELSEKLTDKLKSALYNVWLFDISVKCLLIVVAITLSVFGVKRRLRNIKTLKFGESHNRFPTVFQNINQ